MMKLNIVGPICSTGYGIAAYNIIKELSKKNDITLYPISQVEFQDDFIIDAIERQQKPDLEAPCLSIWHQDQLQKHVGRGENIGFPIFELDTFTPIEKSSLSHCDRLFVCSQWAKDVIKENLRDFDDSKIHVIPLAVDSTLFSSANQISRDQTVFLNVGKWETRKGHDILIRAFNEAFDEGDNVELWMLAHNPFLREGMPHTNESWQSLYKNSKNGSKIRIIPRQQTHQDVYNIMRQADCGVFPALAEGWNLELLEMMACGKSVIATNYSAHTEFCNKDNCHLIEIDELEDAHDGIWFKGQGRWAKFGDKQFDTLVERMRHIHLKKQSGELQPNVDGVFTANKYSWKNTAKEIMEVIDAV
jgi:glycosyltransferase involved in cell wall biosynthesis